MTLRPGHDSIMYDKSGKLRKAIHDVYLLDALAWLCSSNWPIGYAHQVRAHIARYFRIFQVSARAMYAPAPGRTMNRSAKFHSKRLKEKKKKKIEKHLFFQV